MKYRSKEEKTPAITIIAIVAALAVLRVAVITVAVITVAVTIPMQQAKAQQTGCPLNTPAPNASKGRCFLGG
jgi:hypothetical protein